MSNAALVQLLDMGIPLGRAKAALKRTKGDSMSAAERVFAGEFDEIPSDDEGDDAEANASGSAQKITEQVKQVVTISDSDEDMVEDDEDAEISYGEEDDDGYDDMDDGFGYDGMSDDEPHASDPYAGIFFSKDRVEEVIEPIDDDEFKTVPTPSGNTKIKILGRGAWMSGCPEGGEQSFLFQLYNTLEEGQMACSNNCGHSFTRKNQDFFGLFPTFSQYTEYLANIIRPKCAKCAQITCLACGERVDRPSALRSHSHSLDSVKGKGRSSATPSTTAESFAPAESLFHCANLQGAVLGIGLHMIDQNFKTGKDQTRKAALAGGKVTPPTKKRKSAGEEDDAADTTFQLFGKGKSAVKGTGYAGELAEDRTGQIAAEKAQAAADALVASLLQQVSVFLPNPNRAGGGLASDYHVHPTVLAHLRRRSTFVNDLLRNDSLLDMSKRGDLYRALFDWLEIVSDNESLSSMLGMPSMRPARSVQTPNDPTSSTITYEGAPSPRELLENVVIQAQAALRGLQGVQSADEEEKDRKLTEEELRASKAEVDRLAQKRVEQEKNDENSVLKAFCLRIVKSAETIDKRLVDTKGKTFVERMKAQLPRIEEGGNVEEAVAAEDETDENIIKIYEEWATKARFQYIDLSTGSTTVGAPAFKHAYSASASGIENNSAPKRSLAIAKELAILTTNLPVAYHSTIFLRVDETRVDVLKAMITGPEGTPYENGCYLFDIFLPLEYNVKSPMVKYMTTNGGKFRYNPNLYSDGKVCLSLLGTWAGPGWIPGQSTLLQVLISIQSLILCDEPYCNEPGWANDGGSPQSKAYNANVRRMVLLDAMANNIKKPPHPFENEIKTHFRLKAKTIRQQIGKWRAQDDKQEILGDNWRDKNDPENTNPESKRGFAHCAREVLRLLDELEGKPPGEYAVEPSGEGSGGKAGGAKEKKEKKTVAKLKAAIGKSK
ncbi:hypothetical protein B9479_006174 [Cryptococcus floricola]|uniref:UBC core domain-containing protein n=1 Tax=Cryptococcus floricola TaxID=2591691 RepID=A0A5D3ATV0_9TREE|nr:hypothetical protein B9479_006174 [Cryptococcus floricola]